MISKLITRGSLSVCSVYAALATVSISARQIYHSTNKGAAFAHNHPVTKFNAISRNYVGTLHASAESDDEIETKTNKWIDNVVIGLNMCPFAEKTRSQEKLFMTIVRADDVEEILAVVLYESILRKDDAGTTVVVCPELSPNNFMAFYDVVAMAEEMLLDQDLDGIIQIAPFHPLFEFQGSGKDGVDNLTNRSPYPILHVLREAEVSKAVKKLDGDSSKVWNRNILFLESMQEKYGRAKVNKIMSGSEKSESLRNLLKSINLDEQN